MYHQAIHGGYCAIISKNLVNWALYRQETNNSQRQKYEQDLKKLHYTINIKVQVTKQSWRGLKVDAIVKMEAGIAEEVATFAQISLSLVFNVVLYLLVQIKV